MKFSLASGALTVGAVLAMSGCGGGSDDDSQTNTAYYIDSAVGGIHFVCGSKTGETGEDGSFSFQAGAGCTFSLGGMEVRSVDADALFDGARIVESSVNIGRLLQMLDNDGDAGNGITITPEVTQAIAGRNITSLPDSESDFEALNQVLSNVEGYRGRPVDENSAASHMWASQTAVLVEMLAGQTFYVPGENDGAAMLTRVTINADATHATATRLIGSDSGNVDESGIAINGNRVTMTDAGFDIKYAGSTKAYLRMDEQHEDGTSPARWYHSKAEAEAYMQSLQGSESSSSSVSSMGSSSSAAQTQSSAGQSSAGQSSSQGTAEVANEFTTQMLAGKTFYTYGYGEEEGVPETENRFVVTFSADASHINVHNHSDDAYDEFSVNGTSSIVDGKMVWHVVGMAEATASAVKIFADGSIMAMVVDAAHFDPYPQLFSATERADKGQALYNAFMAEQALTRETMTANPWYGIDWAEYDINDRAGDLQCQALFMYNEDNTVDVSFMDNGTEHTMEAIGTYDVSGNRLESEFSAAAGEGAGHSTMSPIAVLDGEIVWDNKTAYFKNRADAVAFVELLGGGAGCYDHFPAQP